LNKATICTHG
jgi:hypothetical protein